MPFILRDIHVWRCHLFSGTCATTKNSSRGGDLSKFIMKVGENVIFLSES